MSYRIKTEADNVREEVVLCLGTQDVYTYRGVQSTGTTGTVIALYQRFANGRERSFCVKVALSKTGSTRFHDDRIVKLERDILAEFRGEKYIVQTMDLNADPFGGLGRDYFAMEILRSGTLLDLHDLVHMGPRRIPNRILWSFFRSLLQAVKTLARPFEGALGGICHEDIHLENIMIGDVDASDQAHNLIPPLKLIDFGRCKRKQASYNSNDRPTADNNFRDLAEVMILLINGDTISGRRRCQGVVANGVTKTIEANVPARFAMGQHYLKWLDPDLRHLLVRCKALDISDRPTIEELLGRAEHAVTQRGYEYYKRKSFPYYEDESDAAVAQFLDEYILTPARQRRSQN